MIFGLDSPVCDFVRQVCLPERVGATIMSHGCFSGTMTHRVAGNFVNRFDV